MSNESDDGTNTSRVERLPNSHSHRQHRRASSGGDGGRFSHRNGRRHSSGEELLEDEVGRLAMEMMEREREQVIIMQPTTTILRLGEEEGDIDQDSGISCEDHLLKDSGGPGPGGPPKEKMKDILIQVFIPFMIAGLGMMTAGLLLDTVQHWDVYMNINEIFVLVPALLGLKGNLEMTLASRLSTAANVGQLDSWASRWRLTWGNLSLIQGQALVVAGFATLISIMVGADLAGSHMLLLGASAMGAASIASGILGSIMVGVILASHSLGINPDNIATPIAASLGDLVTLGLLSLLAKGLYDLSEQTFATDSASGGSALGTALGELTTNATTTPYATITVSSIILIVLVCLIPVWLFLSYKNISTRNVLFYGWIPVIFAMCISSGGGWVLSKAVSQWEGIAIYSPIINGVGGNLVAVQASRISTSLHSRSTPGRLPLSQKYHGPLGTFCSGSQHSHTAILLLCMVVPGSLVFLTLIHVLQAGHTTFSLMFVIGYILCSFLQVCILLLMADWMLHLIWTWGFDPDNIAIPFLTALGDLLGTGLLSLGFLIMWQFGDKDTDVGD